MIELTPEQSLAGMLLRFAVVCWLSWFIHTWDFHNPEPDEEKRKSLDARHRGPANALVTAAILISWLFPLW